MFQCPLKLLRSMGKFYWCLRPVWNIARWIIREQDDADISLAIRKKNWGHSKGEKNKMKSPASPRKAEGNPVGKPILVFDCLQLKFRNLDVAGKSRRSAEDSWVISRLRGAVGTSTGRLLMTSMARGDTVRASWNLEHSIGVLSGRMWNGFSAGSQRLWSQTM